jgi:hypothetical protein
MVALIALITLSAGAPTGMSSANASATHAVANGTIVAHFVGCVPEKGGRVVEFLNDKSMNAVQVHGQDLTLTVPQGFDSISVSVGNCVAQFDALALGGSEREVVVVAKPGTADRKCCETDDIYTLPGGHLMGHVPGISGLSVRLTDAKGKIFVADVQRGTYYFDLLAVGRYELEVQGQNWYKIVREIDVADTNDVNRSSLIVDISSRDAWTGILDEF